MKESLYDILQMQIADDQQLACRMQKKRYACSDEHQLNESSSFSKRMGLRHWIIPFRIVPPLIWSTQYRMMCHLPSCR